VYVQVERKRVTILYRDFNKSNLLDTVNSDSWHGGGDGSDAWVGACKGGEALRKVALIVGVVPRGSMEK